MSEPNRNIASRGATMAVDWEQRIDYSRLRTERLARAKAKLEESDLGALLLFDPNNIRYVTSTHIGEWARDKNARWTLLPRGEDPILWDFGSAARHHQLFAPWLPPENFRAGVAPMRGAMPVETGVPDRMAESLAFELRERGLLGEPVGVDMADMVTLEALKRAGIHVTDGSRVMLEARKIKTSDEIALLDHACGIVDAVYEEIYRMLRPGVYEHKVVAKAQQLLFEMGSDHVEAINAVSGDRCNPHPHVFSDRLLRPGDQAFFDVIHSFMGYRTCYYRTFNVGGISQSQLDAYKQCREWLDAAIDLVRPGHDDRRDRGGLAERRGARVPERGGVLRPPVRPRRRGGPVRAADDLARPFVPVPDRDRGGDGLRARDLLRRDGRPVGGADRGGGRRHEGRKPGDHPLPGRGAARRGQGVRSGRGHPGRRAIPLERMTQYRLIRREEIVARACASRAERRA